MRVSPKQLRKRLPPATIKSQVKKDKTIKKLVINQIIDVDAQAHKNDISDDLFISELVDKCNSFFSWLSNPQSHLLAENLWKNKALENAAKRFPQLNFYELSKLVERDWQQMSEEHRQSIKSQFSQLPSSQQLTAQIASYSPPE